MTFSEVSLGFSTAALTLSVWNFYRAHLVDKNKCSPTMPPTHVLSSGGDHRHKVTWHAAGTWPWLPVTGYQVTAKAAGHPAVSKTVGPTATSVALTGARPGVPQPLAQLRGGEGTFGRFEKFC